MRMASAESIALSVRPDVALQQPAALRIAPAPRALLFGAPAAELERYVITTAEDRMGLDIVEMVMALEQSFEIRLP